MSSLIKKIETKIKIQEQIPDLIEKIDNILSNNNHILCEDDIDKLEREKIELEKKIIRYELSFDKKFNNFFYNIEDLEKTNGIEWLIPGVVPSETIGVYYGASGSGKSSLILRYCYEILKNYDNAYIFYIDADMGISKITELGIGIIMEQYQERFRYAGKSSDNISVVSQNLLKEIAQLQLKYPNKKYIVVEDSLTLITPRKHGFISVENLYRYEKKIRNAGGTVIVIHHLNKSGLIADSIQIENYSDYTYLVNRNEFNNSLLLIPKKASRYSIREKAYRIENRKIVEEVDFQTANISYTESYFVTIILELLLDGEMNQSEIIKYLKQISFFTKFSIGEKKVISLLEKWAKNGKWCFEHRVGDKNAKYYFLRQSEKLAKLPNKDIEGI